MVASDLTNVWTYFKILFIFFIFVGGISMLGLNLLSNPNANLDNESEQYIANMNKIPTANASRGQLEGNGSLNASGSPKDFAIEYYASRSEESKVKNSVKAIFSFPSTVVTVLFRQDVNDWDWVLDIIVWLIGFGTTVALYNYWRKGS